MTNDSLMLAIIVGGSVALVVAWVGRNRKLAWASAGLSVAISMWIATPVLLGHSGDWWRWVSPREAVEWIPLGLLGLAIASTAAQWGVRFRALWLGLGILGCLALAIRLMYGSIYLRPADLQWSYLLAILAWGSSMATLWLAWPTWQRPTVQHSHVLGALQLTILLATALNLGMSGSFQYAGAGIVITCVSACSWLGSKYWSSIQAIAGVSLLGLGPTFAETSWTATGLLGLAWGLSLLSRIRAGRKWLVVVVLATLTTTAIATGITAVNFRSAISGTSQGASGYEAYK